MFRNNRTKAYNQSVPSPSKLKAMRGWQPDRIMFSMHRAILLCARSALWGLLVSCVLAFWSITFARPTGWYKDDQGHHFQALWDSLEIQSQAALQVGNVPVMPGMNTAQARNAAAWLVMFTCSKPHHEFLLLSCPATCLGCLFTIVHTQ